MSLVFQSVCAEAKRAIINARITGGTAVYKCLGESSRWLLRISLKHTPMGWDGQEVTDTDRSRSMQTLTLTVQERPCHSRSHRSFYQKAWDTAQQNDTSKSRWSEPQSVGGWDGGDCREESSQTKLLLMPRKTSQIHSRHACKEDWSENMSVIHESASYSIRFPFI